MPIYDSIVLGAGGIGSSACLELARSGARVLGLEQYPIAHALGSSHGETRIFRQAYFEHADYVPLLKRSRELWRRLESDTGQSLYEETGILYLCPSQSPLLQGIRESTRLHALPLQELEGAQREAIAERFKHERFDVALLEPQAGFLRVEDCVRAQVDEARKLGAEIHESERVISWTADEHQVRVVTDRTEYLARKLVITAGPWMSRMLATLDDGIKLPLRVLRKTLVWVRVEDDRFNYTHPSPCYLLELPQGVFYGFPSLGDGTIKVAEHSGGTEVADPATVDRSLRAEDERRALGFVEYALNGARAEVVRHAVCMYTSTPDEHFVLDLHPRHRNVVLASCCSGHGFKFAPALGEAIAELALTGKTRFAVGFLGLRRFAGSPA